MFYFNNLHSKLRSVGLIVLAAGLAAILPLSAQVGLGLSPMRQELKMKPGGVQSGVLRLVNESQATRVRTDILDFYLDAEQTPQFLPSIPQQSGFSCRNWLQINPMEADLPHSSELAVRYTIRVPADAQPRSYNCATGFTSLPVGGNSQGIGMRSAVRILSAFYVIVGDPPVQGGLKNISIERAPGSQNLRAVVLLENSGLMYYRPTGMVTVSDLSGQVLESFEIPSVAILPQREQRLLFPLTKVTEKQPCKISVKVDVGSGEVQEGTATVGSGVPTQ
jgi:hypothetical protein